jgi:hypothetical protein
MRNTHAWLLFPALLVLATACKPNLGSPPSLIEGPRILAVRGTPAEAAEGDPVTYDVLAVDPMGRIPNPTLTWASCHDPKPPASANAVSASCLAIDDDVSTASPIFMAPMPDGACKVFGPQPPETQPGKPPLRPQDPDVTGGFYQPVRATLVDGEVTEVAFALERLKCRLANAPPDITGMFNQMIKLNGNPAIASVTLDPAGTPVALFTAGQDMAPPTVPATPPTVAQGAAVTLEVAWPADTPESYPVWNLVTQTLDTHRESLSVSWFATDGSFAHDRTGRGETEPDLTSNDVWTAPTTLGLVHLWVLLRDIRGGVDFAETQVMVGP